jgi:hypothetical protein
VEPGFNGMLFMRLRLAPPNAASGADTGVQVVPSGDDSTRYLPVEALRPSPHVPDGLIWMSAMLTARGSPQRRLTHGHGPGFDMDPSAGHRSPIKESRYGMSDSLPSRDLIHSERTKRS